MSDSNTGGNELFVDRIYYPGKHSYHTRKQCGGENVRASERVSLIRLSRTQLSPCGKCDPPEKPVEYALCLDCGWESPVKECERDRGYKGPCPGCGSAKTTSDFRRSLDTDNDP